MKNNRIYGIVLLILGLIIGLMTMYIFMPKKAPIEVSHNMVVQNIERLGNLEVVRYNIRDVVEYKKVRQWLPNAKTVLVASGEVFVSVNLNQVRKDDIKISRKSITLTLPQPVLSVIKINHSQSKIFNMEFGLWESGQLADEAYKQAEKYLTEQARNLDYEAKGRENAIALLTPILQNMGFENVMINFKPGHHTLDNN